MIEVVSQAIFVREPAEDARCRMFDARLRDQDFTAFAVARVAPYPAVEALAVVPEHVAAIHASEL